MIDWEKAALFMLALFLGISVFLLGIGWKGNSDRIDVLSKRIYDIEKRAEKILLDRVESTR